MKTHCVNGHEYTEENTRYKITRGCRQRVCRACNAIKQAQRRRSLDALPRSAAAVNAAGMSIDKGYRRLLLPTHPRAKGGYVFEHVVIAERTLGHSLPDAAVVHHVNGDRGDNRQQNLVVCENQSYHLLLHRRQRAVDAGHPANWLWCQYCRRFDAPENMHRAPSQRASHHKACAAEWQRKHRNYRNYRA